MNNCVICLNETEHDITFSVKTVPICEECETEYIDKDFAIFLDRIGYLSNSFEEMQKIRG